MNAYQTIGGYVFQKMLRGGFALLQKNRSVVNDLNVFPIPDGDTGSNLCMTLEGGLRALEGRDLPDIGTAAAVIADGALLSARGNSGVIFSQLLCGIAEGLSGTINADATDLARAFQSGVRKAYDAVLTPTEGTILTVAREAADSGSTAVRESGTLPDTAEFFRIYIDALYRSLLRTPDLLPVLKEADVVDSGGAGLYYIMEGMRVTLLGKPLPDESEETTPSSVPTESTGDIPQEINCDSTFPFGYCTETLLQLQRCKVDPAAFSEETFVARLTPLGNSIVTFRTGDRVKLHIHAKEPGKVLALCQEYGELLKIKIENMTLQKEESRVEDRFRTQTAENRSGETPRKPYGILTVADGEGIVETFYGMGADAVVAGGAGSNPSAKDFLDAIHKIHAQTVFLLPNNGNILLAARQAAGLCTESQVIVLESKTVGEGYAALSMFDPDCGDCRAIATQMEEAMAQCKTGNVSQAVRDARFGDTTIQKGQYIGFCGKELLCVHPSPLAVAEKLLECLHAEEHEVLLCIYGAEATAQDRAELPKLLRRRFPRTDLFEIEGKQPLHRFLFVLE